MLTPLELIDQVAALVPPPRVHRHRYCGVLAPNAPLRAAVTALAPLPVSAPAVGTPAAAPHRAAARGPPLWEAATAAAVRSAPAWDHTPRRHRRWNSISASPGEEQRRPRAGCAWVLAAANGRFLAPDAAQSGCYAPASGKWRNC